jgi:hypothetical protein
MTKGVRKFKELQFRRTHMDFNPERGHLGVITSRRKSNYKYIIGINNKVLLIKVEIKILTT